MNYQQASDLRTRAETTADPSAYQQAGLAFELLGMPVAATRMFDRADHYRSDSVAVAAEPSHASAG